MELTKNQNALWDKIYNFELDELDASLTFTDRLARENGWDIEYSVRAIFEYKRFVFLQCIAPHSLTPSDQVDQVWHLHLLYTHSYWIDLCKNTLGIELHHGPTKGGKQEGEKYFDLYQKTLDLYKMVFKCDAPKDIWPLKEERFADMNFQRINLDKYWVFKKLIT